MAKVNLPISKGFYVSDSLPISNQRCVNLYPNVPQSDTVTEDNLFSTPGLVEIANVSDIDTSRGADEMAGIHYSVIGNVLWKLNRTVVAGENVFTIDNLGTIEGSDRVFMANNGTQLCIVAPPDDLTVGKTYIFDGTLAEITDVNFDGPAASVVYIDGYFSFHKSDGKKFFNSPLNDGRGLPLGAAYDPLDFSTADANPDQIVAQAVYKNQLYVLGSESTQVFRTIARSPAPFFPITGAIDVGITAPHSIGLFGGSFAFVGSGQNEGPSVWVIQGANRRKLSTTAIDSKLSKLSAEDLSNVFSWVYSDSGAYFYGLTLPDTCFVYDSINKRWHERTSQKDNAETQYRVASTVKAYGLIIVTDQQDGTIGMLDLDSYLEYGSLIRRFITTKPFDNKGDPVFVASIEAVIESGVGLANDVTIQSGTSSSGAPVTASSGEDPKITLFWSDDGGRNFVGGRSQSMGKIGQYKKRAIWNRLGRFPDSRSLMLEVSSPNKVTLIKAIADIG